MDKGIQIVLIRHGESLNNIIYDEIRARFGADVKAEVVEDEEGKMRRPDPGLSDRGMKQAQRLGQFFGAGFDKALNPIEGARLGRVQGSRQPSEGEKKHGASVVPWQVWTSPMQRALVTTREMIRAMGQQEVVVRVHPELYESGGCYEHGCGLPGATKSEILSEFPEFVCEPGMDEGWYHGRPSMETNDEFMTRMDRVAAWLRAQQQHVVLVIHGNLISGLINRLVLGSEGNSAGNMGGLFIHYNSAFTHLQLFVEPLSQTDLSSPKVPITSILGTNRIDHLVGCEVLLSGARVHDDHWIQEFTPLLQVYKTRAPSEHKEEI